MTRAAPGRRRADLGRALAYAAALRVARFGTGNEHGDWETAHHVFTYANAVHQALKRRRARGGTAARGAARGVLHGAMAVYLARYLNVPPARLPGEERREAGRSARRCGAQAALLDASTAGTRSSWRHGWSPVISRSAIRQSR